MNEIRRGPSHTLAMMGLSIIMPFAPGKLLLEPTLGTKNGSTRKLEIPTLTPEGQMAFHSPFRSRPGKKTH